MRPLRQTIVGGDAQMHTKMNWILYPGVSTILYVDILGQSVPGIRPIFYLCWQEFDQKEYLFGVRSAAPVPGSAGIRVSLFSLSSPHLCLPVVAGWLSQEASAVPLSPPEPVGALLPSPAEAPGWGLTMGYQVNREVGSSGWRINTQHSW